MDWGSTLEPREGIGHGRAGGGCFALGLHLGLGSAPRSSFATRTSAIRQAHGQGNPLALRIDFEHLDLDYLPSLHHGVRIFHKLV